MDAPSNPSSPTNGPVQDVVAGRIPIFADRTQWDRDRAEIGRDIEALGESLRRAIDPADAMERLKRGLREARDTMGSGGVPGPGTPAATAPAAPAVNGGAGEVERMAEAFTRALVRFESVKPAIVDQKQDHLETLMGLIQRLMQDVKDQMVLIRTEVRRLNR